MRSSADPLYVLFEQHLYSALVEDETTDDFLARVVGDYLARLSQTSIIPQHIRPAIEEDLRDEVLEMLRKKTYGHYNLREFRKAASVPAAPGVATAPAAAESTATPVPAKPARASTPRARRRRAS